MTLEKVAITMDRCSWTDTTTILTATAEVAGRVVRKSTKDCAMSSLKGPLTVHSYISPFPSAIIVRIFLNTSEEDVSFVPEFVHTSYL